jgi:hypothetical protein
MLKQVTRFIIIPVFFLLSACNVSTNIYFETPGARLPKPETAKPAEAITPTSLIQEATPAPIESAVPTPSTPIIVIHDHTQARDAAMQHVTQTYNLPAPESWNTEDLTPKNMLGSSVFQYTSNPWVVRVSAPVVALDQTIYTVVIDHTQSGLHWEGMVNAFGDLAQANVTPPALVDSPAKARDQAVNYIEQNHGLSLPGVWTFIDTPQTMIGATRYRYTADPWVVNVLAPAGAPPANVYQVTVDNLNENIKWQGEVTSQGVVTERSYTQGE